MCHAVLNCRSRREEAFPLKVGTDLCAQRTSSYQFILPSGPLRHGTSRDARPFSRRMSTFPAQVLDLTFLTFRFPSHSHHPRFTFGGIAFRKNTSVYIKTNSLRA